MVPAEIERILDDTIQSYKEYPVDLLEIKDAEGEFRYNEIMKSGYLKTLCDLTNYFQYDSSKSYSHISILELGCFLGVVSVCLSRLGFTVTASDIPEYGRCTNLVERFRRHGVRSEFFNLRIPQFPFHTGVFDALVMCETLEHLNFNPLPALQEINRILKDDGLLYLTTPNMASLKNRLALLRGRSIHNSIRDYFAQLDKNDNMIVGLHWREYTAEEVKEMLERLGFEVVNQYLYTEYTVNRKSSFKDIAKNVLIKSIPDLRERLVTIARKRVYPELDFFLCDANR